MKTILILLATLITFQVSARSIDRTELVAKVEVNYYGIDSVVLLEDGRMQIRKGSEIITKYVYSEELYEMIDLRDSLLNVNIKVEYVENRCVFIVAPYSPYLTVYESSQPGRMILSPLHCGMSRKVYPSDQEAREVALALRDQLVQLAVDLLGDALENPVLFEPLLAM